MLSLSNALSLPESIAAVSRKIHTPGLSQAQAFQCLDSDHSGASSISVLKLWVVSISTTLTESLRLPQTNFQILHGALPFHWLLCKQIPLSFPENGKILPQPSPYPLTQVTSLTTSSLLLKSNLVSESTLGNKTKTKLTNV